MKTTSTTTHTVELRDAYDDYTHGPVVKPEARMILLAGLRACHPDRNIPDSTTISFRGRTITYEWVEE